MDERKLRRRYRPAGSGWEQKMNREPLLAWKERKKGEGMIVIALREKAKQEGPYIGRKES
jgi:hypothetical protein